jgi:hypothetical protein
MRICMRKKVCLMGISLNYIQNKKKINARQSKAFLTRHGIKR